MSSDKKISVKKLIDLGLLKPNSELIWKKRTAENAFLATITDDGSIRVADGSLHKSLSGAARHLNSGKPIDGWNVWRVKESEQLLSEIRINARGL
jgi:hypothetical protein